jgi:tRNA-splicing ligase RtcB
MKIYGRHDERTIDQLRRCIAAERGATGVLCADGHLGYSMPIGGVVAYRDHVSPSGVGFDIACGNLAVQTPIAAADVSEREFTRLADEIQRRVSFGVGRHNNEPVDHPVFERIARSPALFQRSLLTLARDQLGTVGSGNHYVDLLEDTAGRVWVGVHFGSRGFGHRTATAFLNLARGREWNARAVDDAMDAPPTLLPIAQPLGQDYIAAMTIAGDYACAGREAVVATVLDILQSAAADSVHNHHNFAWRERHHGEQYWVVRKGATPAFPGQRGFVGGSMADDSVILRGVDGSDSAAALYSTVHGAGRVMSRRQAAGKARYVRKWSCRNYRYCDFQADRDRFQRRDDEPGPACPTCGHKLELRRWMERVSAGLVNFIAVKRDLAGRGIILRGGGADEAPQVYRRLRDVLACHDRTIKVEEILTPRVVVMAGGDVDDPYQD